MRGVIVIQKEEENSSEFSLKADSSKVFLKEWPSPLKT